MAGSETTTSFPISLRPWQKEEDDSKAESLGELIFRMHNERKGFRHITKESLRKEIWDEENGVSKEDDEEIEEVEEENEKGTKRFIAKKRAELFQNLHIANEQIGYAKDTLSLLESRYIPTQGSKTMSPALKEALPLGTLSYDRWQPPMDNKRVASKINEKNAQEALVFRGACLTALDTSANALLQAASRLNKDVVRETEYLGQLVLLTKAGYPVFRMPNDKRTLAVQFGAREAGPLFRDRGIAALRANDDGSVKLNQSLTTKPKTTRLRIMENDSLVYTSAATSNSRYSEFDTSLESLIRHAQDSLFEEELFHEMVIEARDLQSLGVRLRGNIIHVPLSARQDHAVKRECLIDLLPLDEISNTLGTTSSNASYDTFAITFRFLLSHAYRQRLKRRSQIPLPLSERPRITPSSYIIRPVMAISQHTSAHHPLEAYLTSVATNLKAAGLSISYISSPTPTISGLLRNVADKSSSNQMASTLYALLDSVTKPIINTVSLTMPSAQGRTDPEKTIKIDVSTNILAPQFGTEYNIYLPTSIARMLYGPNTKDVKLLFTSVIELNNFVSGILSLDISRNILLPRCVEEKWEHSDEYPVISKVVEHEDQKKILGIKVLVDAEKVVIKKVWLGNGKEDGGKVWNDSDAKQGLLEVIEKWVGEFADSKDNHGLL